MIRGIKRNLTPFDNPKRDTVEARLDCQIHNRFDIELVDSATGEVKQKAQAENVICNALWTRLLSPATYFNYIAYGTGTGTPAATDTALFTYKGYGTPATADDLYTYDFPNGVVSLRRKIQLSESAEVGTILSEVGVSHTANGTSLVTHAMLKDMNGNPITITKTATDIINIYATVFFCFNPNGYDSGSITITPVACSAYNALNIYSYFLGVSIDCLAQLKPYYSKGITTSQGAGYKLSNVGYFDMTSFTRSYSVANKTITLTETRLGVNVANLDGGHVFANVHTYRDLYSGSIAAIPFLNLRAGGSWCPGLAITGEAIGTGDGATKDFSTDFFHVASGAKIYVDGVEQTGVTVDIETPKTITEFGEYFEVVKSYTTVTYALCLMSTHSIDPYHNPAVGDYTIYYNPYYQYGIKTFSATYLTNSYDPSVFVSNDLSTWVEIPYSGNGSVLVTVPVAYKCYKYWKLVCRTVSRPYIYALTPDTLPATDIHFTTAPASGAVITADYTTKTIAKDVNHVFDLAITISLGEKTT